MATSLFQPVDAALAVNDPETKTPFVSRVALGLATDGVPVSLVSQLAQHTRALQADASCALLIGEPGAKGDVLSHPRLTLQARAEFVDRVGPEHAEMAAQYMRGHPKSKLYLSLGDFGFVRFVPIRAFLNGGFGKAFQLAPNDLKPGL